MQFYIAVAIWPAAGQIEREAIWPTASQIAFPSRKRYLTGRRWNKTRKLFDRLLFEIYVTQLILVLVYTQEGSLEE